MFIQSHEESGVMTIKRALLILWITLLSSIFAYSDKEHFSSESEIEAAVYRFAELFSQAKIE